MKPGRILIAISVLLLGIAIALVMSGGAGSAKRGPRPKVPNISINGIEIRASNTPDYPGYIEAWNPSTKKLLWRKRVYYSFYDPLGERDVQWTFIRSMSLEASGTHLLIMNEDGKRYRVKITPPRDFPIWLLLATCIGAVVVFIAIKYCRQRSSEQGVPDVDQT